MSITDEYTIVSVVVKCASPTCALIVTIDNSTVMEPGTDWVNDLMKKMGWVNEQQPGDDRPMLYCPRCHL